MTLYIPNRQYNSSLLAVLPLQQEQMQKQIGGRNPITANQKKKERRNYNKVHVIFIVYHRKTSPAGAIGSAVSNERQRIYGSRYIVFVSGPHF